MSAEPDVPKHLAVEKVSSIKHERRLHHRIINPLVIIRVEHLPLSHHDKRVGALSALIWVREHLHLLIEHFASDRRVQIVQLEEHLLLRYHWVVNVQDCSFLQQQIADVDGR